VLKVVQTEQVGQLDAAEVTAGSLLDEIAREGARRMLAAALKAEADAYVDALVDQVDESGHRLVVRNGHHDPRTVLCAAGAVEVRAPRVKTSVSTRPPANAIASRRRSCRRGADAVRRSARCCRCCICTVCPVATSCRRSSNSWAARPACRLRRSPGSPSSGKDEQRAFAGRDLSRVDYVYVWADGIHVSIRLEEDKLCLLVLIGVRADGSKELIALADGYRESTGSWADLLRDAKRRGMRAPVLDVGDGALGFWGALREVFPETREQRCWFQKIANCLGALPKSAHPAAKKALAETWGAEDKTHALAAVKQFQELFGAKFPKAVAKITDDLDELLAFYDYPAEHWVHLRTTNPIESTFSMVRHRTKITRGPGSKAAELAMAFKLIMAAQDRWRAVNAPHLVALVRAGAVFVNGKLAERPEDQQAVTPPAETAA